MTTTVERDDATRHRLVADSGGPADRPEQPRLVPATPEQIDAWLARARGAAVPGATTATVQALTRGDA